MILKDYIDNLDIEPAIKQDLKTKIASVFLFQNVMYNKNCSYSFIKRIPKHLDVEELDGLTETEIEEIIENNWK